MKLKTLWQKEKSVCIEQFSLFVLMFSKFVWHLKESGCGKGLNGIHDSLLNLSKEKHATSGKLEDIFYKVVHSIIFLF